MVDVTLTIFSLAILLFSVVIHELARGSVALSLGDTTAKYAGRLTLNPLKHLDPIGSVILPLMMLLITQGQGPIFGWAKPVPINPYNFRDQKWGSLKVAIAGPLSNIGIALVFGLAIRFLNLPLSVPFVQLFVMVVLVNLLLALFNLIPIPPLDGHWILFSFFPNGFERAKMFLQQYGFFILIFVIFSGVLDWLYSLVQILFSLIVGI